MAAFLWFLGITAVVSSVGYLLLRPLVLRRWEEWQQDREDAQRAQHYARREKVLQEEAVTRVLQQIAEYDDQGRRAA